MSQFALDTSLCAKPIWAFLEALCQLTPELMEMRFATYRPEPKLSERLQNALTKQEQELRDSGVEVCHDNGIPFWDAVFGIAMTRPEFPERFLDVAFSHSGEPPLRSFRLKRDEVSGTRISEMIGKLPSGYGLVVSSRVLFSADEDSLHIPMIDFRCPTSPSNVRAILRVLDLLGYEHGILAESGRSYHFYGTKLLSSDEWRQFMAKTLLFAPLTDPRYIAHRLIDNECRLKVVDSKNGIVPRILHVF